MKYTMDNIAMYVPVTLRTDCLKNFIDSIRLFYPNLPVFIIDNCGKYKNLGKMEEFKDLPVKFIKLNNKNPIPLTKIQWLIGLDLFCEYEALIFSADDIVFTNPGFVEKALRMLNNGDQIVSLSTDKDPVAYLYTFEFNENVGFNIELKGKDSTDTDIINAVKSYYGKFPMIGRTWKSGPTKGAWMSEYLVHYNGGEDINLLLKNIGIDPGNRTSKDPNRKKIRSIK